MHDTAWPRVRPSVVLASALDVLIGLYVTALLAGALGIDLGPLAPERLETPILTLLIAIPLRLTLGGRSWVVDLLRRATPDLTNLRARAAQRIPPYVADVVIVLVASRLATFVIAFVANVVFPPATVRAWQMPFEYRRFAEIFAAWDSGWYFDIAKRGYYFHYGSQSSVAFFPLYPTLISVLAWPFGGGDRALWISGIVISCASFALALMVLHRFTERVFGSREIARRTVVYLAIFPFSLFFTRVYAESLFLLTSLMAISRGYDHRWVQAGLWGALATLCRPNGVLIGLPLALMALEFGGQPSARSLWARFGALLPVPLALAGYSAYVYSLSGDPLGWLAAQTHWGNSVGNPPWRLLLRMIGQLVDHGWYAYFVTPDAPFRLFHGLTALLFLVLVPPIFKRLGLAMGPTCWRAFSCP